MKINLEIENIKELDNILYGINLGLVLLGYDVTARFLGCDSKQALLKFTLEDEQKYFNSAKSFYESLDNIYKQLKIEEE